MLTRCRALLRVLYSARSRHWPGPQLRKIMKRWQTLSLGFIISAVALYFAFRKTNLSAIIEAFRHANYLYVALSASLVLITISIRGFRWMVLTKRRLSFSDGFWLFNIGFLFNNILPARLGEIARAVLAGRR